MKKQEIIDAKNLHYKILNEKIIEAVKSGADEIILNNINGQRYIAAGLKDDARIIVNGVPGNDLGAFMDGPKIIVNSNAQDVIGNTMNNGKIIVHGSCGDITGYGMRAGQIYIKGNAGYRIGIHLKSYKNLLPVIIIGGSVGDFFGEYMGGGALFVLGLNNNDVKIVGNYIGTGMHAGVIYIRGSVQKYQLGKEVGFAELNENDVALFDKYLKDYCDIFDIDYQKLTAEKFTKLIPVSHRPYGKIYAY